MNPKNTVVVVQSALREQVKIKASGIQILLTTVALAWALASTITSLIFT